MVVVGVSVPGSDFDISLGGVTVRELGRGFQGGYGWLNQKDYYSIFNTLGTEHIDPLAYDNVSEYHHSIMSMIVGHRGRI